LEQIHWGGVFVEIADRVFVSPDTDHVSAAVVALGELMERLAGEMLLTDLALEFDSQR
jgi:hypothetical protein